MRGYFQPERERFLESAFVSTLVCAFPPVAVTNRKQASFCLERLSGLPGRRLHSIFLQCEALESQNGASTKRKMYQVIECLNPLIPTDTPASSFSALLSSPSSQTCHRRAAVYSVLGEGTNQTSSMLLPFTSKLCHRQSHLPLCPQLWNHAGPKGGVLAWTGQFEVRVSRR